MTSLSHRAVSRRAVLAAGLFGPVWARATAADGTAQAQEVQRLLPGAREQGRMRLRWFGLPVYEAQLWSRLPVSASNYAQMEFVLGLRYALSLTGAAIAERAIEEMRGQQPLDEDAAKAWLAQMRAAFPDVQSGDRLLGWHRSGRETAFFHNGRPTQVVPDAAFGERFFGIWLSTRSRDAAQRDALLGLAR